VSPLSLARTVRELRDDGIDAQVPNERGDCTYDLVLDRPVG
jgi:hypothetical protein